MNLIRLLALALALALTACGSSAPTPITPDDPSGYTCLDAVEHLRSMGGCGERLDDWALLCRDAQVNEASIGWRLPVGCMSTVASCAEFKRCR